MAAIAWVRVPETRPTANLHTCQSPAIVPSFYGQVQLLLRNRNLLLISAIGLVAAFARTGGMFNVIPLIAESKMHLSPDEIGLGLGTISLLSLTFLYPSGWMVDTLGRKAVIVPTTILSGVAMVLFGYSTTFAFFLLCCSFWAFATGLAGAAPGAYAADVAPAGMNASAMGLYRALSDIGYVVGPLAIGAMSDMWNTGTALWGTAILVVTVGLTFALGADETAPKRIKPGPPHVSSPA